VIVMSEYIELIQRLRLGDVHFFWQTLTPSGRRAEIKAQLGNVAAAKERRYARKLPSCVCFVPLVVLRVAVANFKRAPSHHPAPPAALPWKCRMLGGHATS
jgi:hypothetical protein